jgi:hypothetical protein
MHFREFLQDGFAGSEAVDLDGSGTCANSSHALCASGVFLKICGTLTREWI